MPSSITSSFHQDEAGRRRRATPETADCLAAGDTGAGSDAASDASTSGRSSAASSSADLAAQDPQPLTQAVEDMLRAHLISWGQRLVQLQPKVSGRAGGGGGVGGCCWWGFPCAAGARPELYFCHCSPD
jgi:hypothetical protein